MVQKEVADRMQGRAGNKRLRRIVSCGAVLCRPVYCGKCSAELFHAETEGRISGYTLDLSSGETGTGAG